MKGRKGDMPVHGTENKHEIQTDKAIGAEGSNTEDLTSATDPLLQKIPDTWVKDGRTSPSHWARQRQPGWSGCNGRQTHCHNGHLVDYHRWILTRQAVVDTYQTS